MLPELEQLAARLVRRALDRGATDAECTVAEGDEFAVNLRMREIESVKEAGSRAAGIRVMIGKRSGSAYTSDLSEAGLDGLIASAIDLAAIATEDPVAGLPETDELGSIDGNLSLYCDEVRTLENEHKIGLARSAEEAAFAVDPRISNSEGASFESTLGRRAFANSRGFSGSYRTSSCSLSVVPVARDGDSMERDYWLSLARSTGALESPEIVGEKAARRALRRLHARRVETQQVPVVFEPRVARSLLGHLFSAVSGDAVYRSASFLAGKLGEEIASGGVTIIDDSTMAGLFGSSPFDDEGVPTRRTVVVDKGVLASYLLNTYTARKLGLKTTGNASRGISGNAGVGHGNLFIEPGAQTPEEIIRSVRKGLFVTELMGFGVNTVTGDYSRGAAGLWIENGELAYPVAEVTIASNLAKMLSNIEVVGNDLEFRGSVASPTLLIREMTVSGERQST